VATWVAQGGLLSPRHRVAQRCAYATSWSAGIRWDYFFHHVPPLAAIALSAVIFASIYAATWAQDVYLRKQAALVSRMKAMKLPAAEAIVLKCSGDLVESESTTRRDVLDVTAVESSEAKEARAILCRMDFHRGFRRESI